jgi:hypothetical protein
MVERTGKIVRVNLVLDTAEVVMVREIDGVQHSFLVYIMLCSDGIWRVDSM